MNVSLFVFVQVLNSVRSRTAKRSGPAASQVNIWWCVQVLLTPLWPVFTFKTSTVSWEENLGVRGSSGEEQLHLFVYVRLSVIVLNVQQQKPKGQRSRVVICEFSVWVCQSGFLCVVFHRSRMMKMMVRWTMKTLENLLLLSDSTDQRLPHQHQLTREMTPLLLYH